MFEYICKHCDKNVKGFHNCKKTISTEIKECGCRTIVKEGFRDIYSIYIETFTYLIPCVYHDNDYRIKNGKR